LSELPKPRCGNLRKAGHGDLMVLVMIAELFLLVDLSIPKNFRMVFVTVIDGPVKLVAGAVMSTEADVVVGSVPLVV